MWQEKNNQLYKEFKFKDFKEAFAFMERVAELAEERQHHPRWTNEYGRVEIWLSTHEAGGKVTDKDKSMSKAIDGLLKAPKEPRKNQVAAPPSKKIKLYADGGSRGNPGPSASGYVLIDEEDNVFKKSGVYLGITTNNQAEYQSLKFGLEEAIKLGVSEVDVFMDSLLVVNQLKGKFKVKNRDLWPIHEDIKKIAANFKRISYSHVPRELNKLADAEVNEVLDAEKKKHQQDT